MDQATLRAGLQAQPRIVLQGRVSAVAALSVDIAGLAHHLTVGDRIWLETRAGGRLRAEIVGAAGRVLRAAPFGPTQGLGSGARVHAEIGADGQPSRAGLAPCDAWLGRVIDPLGNPADGGPALEQGPTLHPVRAAPPPAITRARLGPVLDLGVRVLNCFATCRTGQRLGLFSASGVGKSTLLAMLARYTACDVAVLALVGERGREVREFLEDELGVEGLARAVVVVATSDAPPLMRREAAYAAMTVAEHFRDQGSPCCC